MCLYFDRRLKWFSIRTTIHYAKNKGRWYFGQIWSVFPAFKSQNHSSTFFRVLIRKKENDKKKNKCSGAPECVGYPIPSVSPSSCPPCSQPLWLLGSEPCVSKFYLMVKWTYSITYRPLSLSFSHLNLLLQNCSANMKPNPEEVFW